MNLELNIYGKIKMDAHSPDVIDRVLRLGGNVWIYSIYDDISDRSTSWSWHICIGSDGYNLTSSDDYERSKMFGWDGEPFGNLIAFLQRDGWTE
jgi:hypothetical protein